MKRLVAAYRMSPAGGALTFVLGAAVIVLLLGPPHDETPAFIVIAIVLAMFVLGWLPPAPRGSTLAERRRQFHARRRLGEDEPDQEAEAQDWRQERDAYTERDQPPRT